MSSEPTAVTASPKLAKQRRYTVNPAARGRASVIQRRDVVTNDVVDEVAVPHEIIDALANNMPRLLQLIATWSGRSGEVDEEGFERVLHTLGVRYTETQVGSLFRVLDADSNKMVSLAELLMLKFAIDNDVTSMPARPNMDDDFDAMSSHEVVLKIDNAQAVPLPKRDWGIFAAFRPVLGAVWKSELRPHHALDLSSTPWQAGELVEQRVAAATERKRFVYEAGPVGDLEAFCEQAQASAAAAAERACDVLSALLDETRQIDLKLEELRLMVPRGEAATAEEKLRRLKHLMRAMADDVKQSLITQTRYAPAEYSPVGLVGCPRQARVTEELLPADGQKSWQARVGRVTLTLLALTGVLYLLVGACVGQDYWDNQHACEFQHYACTTRPWQYNCSGGRIDYLVLPSNETMAPLEWGEGLMDDTCDEGKKQRSWWFFMPLPTLVLSAVVLPILTFRKNAHTTTVKKLLLWTPAVPLIVCQCFFRACILLSTISDADDSAYASLVAVEALVLVPQVAVFLLMDSMRYPTPMLRIGFAIALVLRFLSAVTTRATEELGPEQHALIPAGPARDAFMGLGSATKQSTLASIDWTITLMLLSSILSVINYPGEMAVVRLRCDTKGYFNWRDQYIGDMFVRAHRRDVDAADSYLWLRSKTDRCMERLDAKMAPFRRCMPGKRPGATASVIA